MSAITIFLFPTITEIEQYSQYNGFNHRNIIIISMNFIVPWYLAWLVLRIVNEYFVTVQLLFLYINTSKVHTFFNRMKVI